MYMQTETPDGGMSALYSQYPLGSGAAAGFSARTMVDESQSTIVALKSPAQTAEGSSVDAGATTGFP